MDGMTLPSCPYCYQQFTPSRYRPNQIVCTHPDCQRKRRTDYHRRKLREDDSYRAQCRDSQQQWREQHPDYMRTYRAGAPKILRENRSKRSCDLVNLLERVKNNVAFDLKSYPARVFLVTDERVKNILASAQLIVIEQLGGK
jgi:hypothetical protein